MFIEKEGYRDSEEAVEEFDLPKLGDANGDGQITIDVLSLLHDNHDVALVVAILGNNGLELLLLLLGPPKRKGANLLLH